MDLLATLPDPAAFPLEVSHKPEGASLAEGREDHEVERTPKDASEGGFANTLERVFTEVKRGRAGEARQTDESAGKLPSDYQSRDVGERLEKPAATEPTRSANEDEREKGPTTAPPPDSNSTGVGPTGGIPGVRLAESGEGGYESTGEKLPGPGPGWAESVGSAAEGSEPVPAQQSAGTREPVPEPTGEVFPSAQMGKPGATAEREPSDSLGRGEALEQASEAKDAVAKAPAGEQPKLFGPAGAGDRGLALPVSVFSGLALEQTGDGSDEPGSSVKALPSAVVPETLTGESSGESASALQSGPEDRKALQPPPEGLSSLGERLLDGGVSDPRATLPSTSHGPGPLLGAGRTESQQDLLAPGGGAAGARAFPALSALAVAERVSHAIASAHVDLGRELTMQLSSEALGDVHLAVSVSRHAVQAAIVTEHEAARALIFARQDVLGSALARHNLQLEGLFVAVGGESGFRNSAGAWHKPRTLSEGAAGRSREKAGVALTEKPLLATSLPRRPSAPGSLSIVV